MGLETLTGKLYIFIAKMAGGKVAFWPFQLALISCYFMMMGFGLFPLCPEKSERLGWGKRWFGLQPREPQT